MTITYPIGSSLYVNVTNRCPNRCAFCIRNNADSVGGNDSLWLRKEPTVDEIVGDIRKDDLSAYKELVFCGYGEPLERLDAVLETIRKLKEFSDIPVRINTNGLADLIWKKPTAFLLKGLVDTVSVSLNAPDARSYQKLCSSDFGLEAFPAVLRYAGDCKKAVPHVMMTVVDVISPEEIEQCRAIAKNLGVGFRVRTLIE